MATSPDGRSGFAPPHETHDPEKLQEMLEEFSTLLLGTFEQTGGQPSLRARPMTIARLDADCSALLRALWSKLNDVWFDGPDDPRAAVMTLRPTEAELWDVSGTKGLRFLLASTKRSTCAERTTSAVARR